MSTPTRIDDDLFEAAKATGEVQSRSAAQQVAHWARIGREFETSAMQRTVARVLSGVESYDSLDDRAQAIVRARWDEGIASRLASLDLAAEFAAAGESWSELDENGQVVRRTAPA